MTEEERARVKLKKKEQASKLTWNDGDGEVSFYLKMKILQ